MTKKLMMMVGAVVAALFGALTEMETASGRTWTYEIDGVAVY